MTILDVGCGAHKTRGALGIDRNPNSLADVLADLDQPPWPLAANAFDRIICSHIVEHVADMVRFMEEIHRVARPGAAVEIVTPHFSSRYSYTDPTHRRHLSLFSFDYFVEPGPFNPSPISRAFETRSPLPAHYSRARFEKSRARLGFARPFRLLGIQSLANRFPHFYEAYWAFLLPARDVYFTLRVLK